MTGAKNITATQNIFTGNKISFRLIRASKEITSMMNHAMIATIIMIINTDEISESITYFQILNLF